MPITPDNLPDDPTALKRIIAAMAQDALTAQAEIWAADFGCHPGIDQFARDSPLEQRGFEL